MPHDDPAVGKIIEPDWGIQLSTRDRYDPVFTGSDEVIADPGDTGVISGAWHRSSHMIHGWARIEFSGSGIVLPSGIVRISLPFDPDASIMDVTSITTGQVFTVGIGMAESTVDGIVYTRIVPNDAPGAISGTHLIRCMRDEQINSLNWSDFDGLGGEELTVNFAYLADPAGL